MTTEGDAVRRRWLERSKQSSRPPVRSKTDPLRGALLCVVSARAVSSTNVTQHDDHRKAHAELRPAGSADTAMAKGFGIATNATPPTARAPAPLRSRAPNVSRRRYAGTRRDVRPGPFSLGGEWNVTTGRSHGIVKVHRPRRGRRCWSRGRETAFGGGARATAKVGGYRHGALEHVGAS